MKKTLKKEMVRRVSTALGPLLYELGAVKSVMPPKDFDLLIEGVLHVIRRVPAITQDNRSVDECLHVVTESEEAQESLTQDPDEPQHQGEGVGMRLLGLE